MQCLVVYIEVTNQRAWLMSLRICNCRLQCSAQLLSVCEYVVWVSQLAVK